MNLLGKAIFTKAVVSDETFLCLIKAGVDPGFRQISNETTMFQFATIAGVSNLVVLSMLAQDGNTIRLIRSNGGRVSPVLNSVLSCLSFLHTDFSTDAILSSLAMRSLKKRFFITGLTEAIFRC